MLGEKGIRRLCDKVLAASPAAQTEVLVMAGETALTRFSKNAIHQNTVEQGVTLMVRAVVGKRVGVATANGASLSALEPVAQRADALARLQPEDPDFQSLPKPLPLPRVVGAATPLPSPTRRARAVGEMCRLANQERVQAFGALMNTRLHLAVANSLGLFAYHEGTTADLNVVAMTDTSAGFGHSLARDLAELDCEAVAREAYSRALDSQNPVALEPGEYPVVLEPYAVSDILDFLGYLGFGATAVQEKRSFMAGSFEKRLLGGNITIWDDGLDGGTIPVPFDFEGVPKQRVDFIVNGVAKAVCYDSYTAGQEGKVSTGHALPPTESTFGPVPLNLFLKPGTCSREELLVGLDRGLLVTRFWYTRVVQPLPVEVTGMTRDGTFLVENGEIVGPVKNLRFTQGYLEALRHVEAIGQETRLVRTMFSYNRVPALRLGNFRFTGATEF